MYMKAYYLGNGNDALKTGIGAEFETPEATKAAFESMRPYEQDIKTAPFFIDLCDADGTIIDSIALSEATYSKVTGEPVLSAAEYQKIDADYWAAAEAAHAA